MVSWLSYYSIPLIVFVAVPAVSGTFLSTGLASRRDSAVPRLWWAMLAVALAWPIAIAAIGFTFVADHPIASNERSNAGALLAAATLIGFTAPFILAATTIHLSDRRDVAWRTGLATACLSFLPATLLAWLGSAQAISGVSL